MKTSNQTESHLHGIDRRLAQDALEAYSEWRAECRHVRECYGNWSGTRGADASLAFGACVSALDREQRAAEKLGQIVGRLGDAAPKPPLYRGLERLG